jgi:Spy/CpxP family protein refolding chaperone
MKTARIWLLGAVLSLLAAPSFAQRGPGGRGGFQESGLDMILRMTEVQRELKIGESQLEVIKLLGTEMRAKMGEIFQGGGDFRTMSREQREKRFALIGEVRAKYENKLGEILNDNQTARLKQLQLQRAGIRVLARPDLQNDLRLTPDQRIKIKETLEGEGAAFREAFANFQPGPGMTNDQREEARRKFTEVRQATDAKLNAVLTDGQKKQFQAMLGTPFKFPPFRFRPRGPRPD